ncbi:MAG TPA: lipid A deacylase LpxR family protein [Chthoniobacterales bacterium]
MISRMRCLHSFFAAIVVSTFSALPDAIGQDHGTITVYFENDLFAGTDRYYTNGTRLSFTSENFTAIEDAPRLPLVRPILAAIPYFQNENFQKDIGFSLGQNTYTPDDTETSERIPGDRPYAGWLYLGFSIDRKNQFQRDAFGVQLGVVGSYSYAEETQQLIHEIRGFDMPAGWDNQLSNEFGVLLTYQRTWRWPHLESRRGLGFEILPHVGAAAGNVAIYASAGAEARLGLNLPDDFGTAPLEAATITEAPLSGEAAVPRARFDVGLYVFGRVEGRLVGHNIFLDGNTFQDSQSVNHKPLVGDLSVGAAINFRNTKLAYAFVYRTQEFSGQASGQLFGSLTLSIAY